MGEEEGRRVTFQQQQQQSPVDSGAVGRQVPRRDTTTAASTPDTQSAKKRSKPRSSQFHQQHLLAYQPVLTPQKAIPFLLFLGLVFIPLGIVFITSSNSVVEYVFDYTDCLKEAKEGEYTDSKQNFEWKREGKDKCLLRFKTTPTKPMGAPVFLYYQLSNFYQNNRLYAKSYNYEQLMGKPLGPEQLRDCEPLIGPTTDAVYYPCGLIANSMFTDQITVDRFDFKPTDIAYSYDVKMYGKSQYDLSKTRVFPPPSWTRPGLAHLNLKLNPDGSYKELPDLHSDQRFMNWMRISGLPTFRKLYGRYNGVIPEQSELVIAITDTFDVASYNGRKSVVISTASWMGGKNRFLGYAYISFGTFLIIVGMVCLAMHLMAPRPLGDQRYLSWNARSE
jgi:hypothetical protein